MLFRKTILFLSAVALSFSTSCTGYQDMLRERDERIRELSEDAPDLVKEQLQKDLGSDAEVRYNNKGRLSIGVDDSVTFDSGSIALKDSSHTVLRNVATALNSKFPGRRIYIEGHTDTDPIQKTKDNYSGNRHLAMWRADAVARYLISQGTPEANIVVIGYGHYDPRDASNKARNRRVEIVVGEHLPVARQIDAPVVQERLALQ